MRETSNLKAGWTGKAFLGAIPVLFAVFLSSQVNATLIVGIYNNETLYVGGDSLTTTVDKNGMAIGRGKTKKLFPISETSCFSISGVVPFEITSNDLESISWNACTNENSLRVNITNIINGFSNIYRHSDSTRLTNTSTRLVFWGYDRPENTFFCLDSEFTPTNDSPICKVQFTRGKTKFGNPLTIAGETFFWDRLFLEPEGAQLLPLMSYDCKMTLASVFKENAIEQTNIINCMLEMFRLQKSQASSYSKDKGWIDEPYVIYKITRTNMTRVH